MQGNFHIETEADGAAHKVAFIGHFLEPRDVREWNPGLDHLSDPACERLLDSLQDRLEPFVAQRRLVRSPLAEVSFTVIGIPASSAQFMASYRHGTRSKYVEAIGKAVDLAAGLGCTVAGLGGYTSIVTDNGRAISDRRVALTSGNALTAAAAVDVLERAAFDLCGTRRLGVVGATGNIGSMVAHMAADFVDDVLLVGRPGARSRLENLAARLAGQCQRPNRFSISVADDLRELRQCNLIVSATNAARPIICAEHLSDQPLLVCDIAKPGDADPRLGSQRPNATIVQGGAIRLPLNQCLDLPGMHLPAGQIFACMAETILLGLSGAGSAYTCGALSIEQVRAVQVLARQHGFEVVGKPPAPAGDANLPFHNQRAA